MTNKTNNNNIEAAIIGIADSRIRKAINGLIAGKGSTVYLTGNDSVAVYAKFQLTYTEQGIGMIDKQGVPIFGQATLADTLLARVTLIAYGTGKGLRKETLYAQARLGTFLVPISLKADKAKQRGFSVDAWQWDSLFSHTASKGFENLPTTTLEISLQGLPMNDLAKLLTVKGNHALSQECNDLVPELNGKVTLYGHYQNQQKELRALRNKK